MTLIILAVTAGVLVLTTIAAWRSHRQRQTIIFLGLASMLLILTAGAAAEDSNSRDYLAIQNQYKIDHPAKAPAVPFNSQVEQEFPAFPAAEVGDTYRTERCISCHVPDIAVITPQQAADNLASDFFKYAPDAETIAKDEGLKSTPTHSAHPTGVSASDYKEYGATEGFIPYTGGTAGSPTGPADLPGYLPEFLNPADPTNTNQGKPYTLDQIGCIVCHNGSRLALDETDAHENLIINPDYDWTEGANLYYTYCVACHGNLGQGAIGPPLNNQDRLGFFNEDYYYRCIEYGYTGFEHIGSVMPAWGSNASDWTYNPSRDTGQGHVDAPAALTGNQINVLIEFIRHWENYQTLP